MVFSSPIFLFLFLPVVLTVNTLLPGTKARNLWLLLMSLVFYAWGQVDFVLLLLASTVMNYGLGLWLGRSESTGNRKCIVALAVFINIGILAFFKYAAFTVGMLNALLCLVGIAGLPVPHITLPIGISFFTFHALSYIIDVYRRKWKSAANPADVALYIFFFPQLIAGPILRWSSIGPQLPQRAIRLDGFADGVRRFVGGLAKKVLIANILAIPADRIFSLPAAELSTADAWLGALCYTLQIYFDFSGYSDMAVGLGKMCGFTFMENFNFPYLSQSLRDFWRRWHISLSTWFRDYLYFPLGGNRLSAVRTHVNLIVVFFLCGLWHGASWTFVVWGLYHGFFLVLERTRFGKTQANLPQTLRHLYTLLVVMMGWVLFRADSFTAAYHYFLALFGANHALVPQPYVQYTTVPVLLAIGLGALFSGPTWGRLNEVGDKLARLTPMPYRLALQAVGRAAEFGLMIALFIISASWLASGTYNPFIYFRF